MPDQTQADDSTTIQVTYEIWAALDRRKQEDETFDDVIRNLIDATGVGVGELQGDVPEVEYGNLEELTVQEREEVDKACAHYDVIHGEQCGNQIDFRQEYRYPEEEDWSYFYYCEEHRP